MTDHKTWLMAEYKSWGDALDNCSIRHFRSHSSVKRMLSDPPAHLFAPLIPNLDPRIWGYLDEIDAIGFPNRPEARSGLLLRHVFYALKVLAIDPPGIAEIGSAAGHFLAVLVALGWRGQYTSFDLPSVVHFQERFLDKAASMTGLPMRRPVINGIPYPFACSFYALGEFDDETKDRYIRDVIRKSEHGLVVWNPHSGASHEITFPCHVECEQPLTGLGNKLLRW